MKRDRRRAVAAVVFGVAALACFVGALMEPRPGHGVWLTMLAGDWAVQITDEFEIGPDPTPGRPLTVYRRVRVLEESGEEHVQSCAEIRGVREFAVNEQYILVTIAAGYAWRARNGSDGWHESPELPAHLAGLDAQRSVPRPSLTPCYFVLAALLAVASGVFMLWSAFSRLGRREGLPAGRGAR